jgi:hypothetical protein
MRLECHGATGYAALLGFAAQQCQHGLVAAVHAVEVADGQRAGTGDVRVVKTAKNLHGMGIYVRADWVVDASAVSLSVMKTSYIVS